jgi:hypothetical protein
MRKAITFTGLILAIAVLIPASALAAAKGTARPFNVSVSMTNVSDLETFTNHYQGTAMGSHLGKGTIEGNGKFEFNEFGLAYNDEWVITTANGDKLFGTSTGRIVGIPGGDEVPVVQTITGGTGRFANATGTITGTYLAMKRFTVGPMVTFADTGGAKGTISY